VAPRSRNCWYSLLMLAYVSPPPSAIGQVPPAPRVPAPPPRPIIRSYNRIPRSALNAPLNATCGRCMTSIVPSADVTLWLQTAGRLQYQQDPTGSRCQISQHGYASLKLPHGRVPLFRPICRSPVPNAPTADRPPANSARSKYLTNTKSAIGSEQALLLTPSIPPINTAQRNGDASGRTARRRYGQRCLNGYGSSRSSTTTFKSQIR
jgi:hypothetical protein